MLASSSAVPSQQLLDPSNWDVRQALQRRGTRLSEDWPPPELLDKGQPLLSLVRALGGRGVTNGTGAASWAALLGLPELLVTMDRWLVARHAERTVVQECWLRRVGWLCSSRTGRYEVKLDGEQRC